MTEVQIPFLERFREPMLNGTKTMTSRRRKYGEVGDIFEAFGATFQIVEVGRLLLGDIASCWKEEGVASEDDFVETWKEIHHGHYAMTERFYYHRFKKVSLE